MKCVGRVWEMEDGEKSRVDEGWTWRTALRRIRRTETSSIPGQHPSNAECRISHVAESLTL